MFIFYFSYIIQSSRIFSSETKGNEFFVRIRLIGVDIKLPSVIHR